MLAVLDDMVYHLILHIIVIIIEFGLIFSTIDLDIMLYCFQTLPIEDTKTHMGAFYLSI